MTWMVRNQASKQQWKSLGRYPEVSIAKARALVAHGADPDMKIAAAYAVYKQILARDYREPEQIYRRFAVDVLPAIGSKPVSLVTKRDVQLILQGIVDRGSPAAANRTLPDIKHFFSWCVERDYCSENPSDGITRRSVGGREVSRARVLSDTELSKFIRILRSQKYGPATRQVLAICLITGQRVTEILGVRNSEIKGSWWTIPKDRVGKNDKPQKVYLTALARRILRHRAQFPKDYRMMDRACRTMKFDPPFTPHDLRRTMATRLAEAGVDPFVIEKMLNHTMTGVMAIYNRAEYLQQRKAAWNHWTRMLLNIARSG